VEAVDDLVEIAGIPSLVSAVQRMCNIVGELNKPACLRVNKHGSLGQVVERMPPTVPVGFDIGVGHEDVLSLGAFIQDDNAFLSVSTLVLCDQV
jgi:hypothetical protein